MPAGPHSVAIVDINMPFWSMVRLMVKWALASIPAIIILVLIGLLTAAVFGGVGTAFISSKSASAVPAVAPAVARTERRIPIPESVSAKRFYADDLSVSGVVVAATLRTEGGDGDTYSVFVVDCQSMTGRVTEAGQSRAYMRRVSENMTMLRPGSERFYLARFLCADVPEKHVLL
jgi:hypothetical protein